jgi:23S rRNA (adenine2503-C2)-methyltransferase
LEKLISLSHDISAVGLQFSIHEAFEAERDKLIPFKNKLTLRQIRDYGITWFYTTGRQVYLNYCVHEHNSSSKEMNRLKDLFPPQYFAFTFSAICESEFGKCSGDNTPLLIDCQTTMLNSGYNVRIFDPAGKDTIGGGCGQLWYVQEYFKNIDKC